MHRFSKCWLRRPFIWPTPPHKGNLQSPHLRARFAAPPLVSIVIVILAGMSCTANCYVTVQKLIIPTQQVATYCRGTTTAAARGPTYMWLEEATADGPPSAAEGEEQGCIFAPIHCSICSSESHSYASSWQVKAVRGGALSVTHTLTTCTCDFSHSSTGAHWLYCLPAMRQRWGDSWQWHEQWSHGPSYSCQSARSCHYPYTIPQGQGEIDSLENCECHRVIYLWNAWECSCAHPHSQFHPCKGQPTHTLGIPLAIATFPHKRHNVHHQRTAVTELNSAKHVASCCACQGHVGRHHSHLWQVESRSLRYITTSTVGQHPNLSTDGLRKVPAKRQTLAELICIFCLTWDCLGCSCAQAYEQFALCTNKPPKFTTQQGQHRRWASHKACQWC